MMIEAEDKGRSVEIMLPSTKFFIPSSMARESLEKQKDWLFHNFRKEILREMIVQPLQGSPSMVSFEDSDEQKKEILEKTEQTASMSSRPSLLYSSSSRLNTVMLHSGNSASGSYLSSSEEEYWNHKRLQILDQVATVKNHLLQSQGPKVVYASLINGLLDILHAGMGFIGELRFDEDNDNAMYLQMHAVKTFDEESDRKFQQHPPLTSSNLDTLVGQVLTTRKPVLCNDPAVLSKLPLPPGHQAIHSFLGIPLFDGAGRVIGNICIANKHGIVQQSNGLDDSSVSTVGTSCYDCNFNERDVELMSLFSSCGSDLIQAYRQLETNQNLIDTLDEKVSERTIRLQEVNERLQRTNKEVQQAARLQLQHFACMSHEIRTPLNCIIGMSSLLLLENESSSFTKQQRESLQLIVQSGELLLAVVNDVLDYSKLETGHVQVRMQSCSLKHVLKSTVHSIQAQAMAKQLRIQTRYSADVPECMHIDPARLQQILYNLLGNAVKFSPENSVVKFTVDVPRRKKEEDGSVTGTVRFVVQDHGPGIRSKDFDSIFLPFRQVQSSRQVHGGTGLGLSISKKLVEAMGGTVQVNSEYGKWTAFTVELPLCQTKLESCDEARMRLYLVAEGADPFQLSLQKIGVDCHVCSSLRKVQQGGQNLEETEARTEYLLVQEDLFDSVAYKALQGSFALATFGPEGSVRESRLHFPSLTDVLPKDLVQSLMDVSAEGSNPANPSTPPSSPKKPAPKTAVESPPSHLSPHASAKSSAPERTLASLRILIAEDNVVNQKVLSRILKRVGVTLVTVVDNGQKAVDRVRQEVFDVVLMDMEMPVMDGVEACRRIMKSEKSLNLHAIQVIFVTAHASNGHSQECSQAGGTGFITKPYTVGTIRQCMEGVLQVLRDDSAENV